MSIERELELPSRGFLYGDAIPDGTVVMRPMKTSEEKFLAGGVKDRTKIVDLLIKECLLTKDLPYEDFLIGDKSAMMLFLRGITYGFDYRFTLRCPNCNAKFMKEMNLQDDFEIQQLEETDTEPFMVDVGEHKVGFRLLRIRDELDIRKYERKENLKRNNVDGGDVSYQYQMARRIMTIDGSDISILEARKFVEDLFGQDSLTLRNAFDDCDCGVNLFIDHECLQCYEDFKQVLPFGVDFFRPESANIRGRREKRVGESDSSTDVDE